MRRFVEGVDRSQTTLFPESLDDWVDENKSVRVIDAFVDALNLRALDFGGVGPETQPKRVKTLHRGLRVNRTGQDPVGHMNSGQKAQSRMIARIKVWRCRTKSTGPSLVKV